MLSGDNLDTAIYCAKQVNILDKNGENKPHACMSGDEFVEMIGGLDYIKVDFNTGERSWDYESAKQANNDIEENIHRINEHTRVLARCTPLHKFLFV